jgi:hypothetical protein
MEAPAPPSPSPAPPSPPPQPPSLPWWRRKAFVLPAAAAAGLFAAVFFLGPPIAGAIAASQIRSTLERELQSDVSVGDVSLSWSGRIRLADLAIRPRGAGFSGPLLEIAAIEASFSLRSALRGEYRAEADVIRPVVRIERGENGRFNYEFPEPPEEVRRRRRRRAGEPPPSVHATIRVRDGEIRVRGDGRETVFSKVSLEAWIESLEQPVGFALALADSSGGRLSVRGEYDVESASGRLAALVEDVALSGLGGVLGAWTPGVSLEGVARGSFEYRSRGIPRFEGRGQLEVKGLALERAGGRMRLDRLVLLHEGSLDEKGHGRQSVTLAADKVLVGSGSVEFGASPRAAVKADFESDLSVVSKSLEGTWAGPALEGIVRLRGSLEAGGEGAAKARWSADIQGESIAADVGGRPARLGSLRLEAAGTVEESGPPSGSVSLRVGEGMSARVDLAVPAEGGAARRLDLAVEADLAEASRIAGEAVGLRPGVRLEGKAALRGRATLREAGESGGELTLSAENVGAVDAEGRRREVERSLGAKLRWSWDGASDRLRVPSLEVATAWSRLEASGEAWRKDGLRPQRLFVKGTADLEKAGAILAFVAAEPPALGGRAEAAVRFEEGKFRAEGTARALVVGGEGVPADASLVLEGRVEFPPEGLRAEVESGTFAWSRAGASVRGGMAGRMSYSRGMVAGKFGVRELEIGDGRKVLAREPRVDLEHDVTFGAGGMEIRKLELVSCALRLEAAGRAGSGGWDLRARARYVPEALGAALRPWWTGRLEGAQEREVEAGVQAPAGEGGLWNFLRRARGEARADLAPITVTGMTLSGRVQAELRDGRLSVAAPLSANGGTAQVAGTWDLRGPEAGPRSSLTVRARGVRANAEMGPFLEKISPIFHTVNGTVEGALEGEAALEWAAPAERGVPAALDALKGKAVFAARDLAVTGSPAVVELLGALGEEGAVRGELLATDVRVGAGRCSYDGMTLRLVRYELRFTGWVGFDGKMALLVELPLTERFLRRHPRLEKVPGKTFFVALEGTVSRPRLDLDRAIQELLRRALEGAAQEKLEDAIRRLLERRKDR